MPRLDLPRGGTFLCAFLAGVLSGLAYEPVNWWPLAFIGIAAYAVLLLKSPRGAFGIGYGYGLGLLGVSLNWLAVLVAGAGPFIAAALIAVEALFFAGLGVAIRRVGRFGWWPLAAAGCWSLCEFAYARLPFGGFGWIRLAYALVDSPLAGLLPWLAASGVSFLAALLGFLLGWLALRLAEQRRVRPRLLLGAMAVGLAVLLAGAAGKAYEPEPAAGSGMVTVGMVQGNVDGSGVGGMGRARSVTNNHLGETITLMAKARAGVVPEPDFVLWPENSTDIDPLQDWRTQATVQAASEIVDKPILVGAVMEGPGPDERQTAALWWEPRAGVTGRYDKRNLVPFGEYIPLRATLLPLIPLLDMVGAQSVPGTRPGVLPVQLADGRTLRLGDVICFELAYDKTVYQAVNGSEVLVVQSNNATYRGTPQIRQQFAITRVRAMEARREIAVATTNSVSGYIDRDGKVLDRTEELRSASNAYVMPRRTAVTPAVRAAAWMTWGLAGFGLFVLGWSIAGDRFGRHRRAGSADSSR